MFRARVYFSFLLLAVVFCAFSQADTLEKADAILARFQTLDAFLADETAVGQYYEVLRARYGKRFHRASYDKIISQIRNYSSDIEGFADRAWETNSEGSLGKPFTLPNDLPISGRATVTSVWKEIRAAWENEIESLATSDGEKAQAIFLNRAQTLAGLDKKKKGDFFKGLAEDEELKGAVAYLIQERLKDPVVRSRWESNDADLILKTLNELTTDMDSILQTEEAKNFKSVVKALFKELGIDSASKNDELFIPITRSNTAGDKEVPIGRMDAGEIEAVPIPRRFHAFFKHIILNECVGGGCSHLESTTPERWATILLEGSQMHEYQRKEDGKFLGYSQATPLSQRGEPDRIFAAVDFGATLLSRRTQIKDPDRPTGYRASTFINEWLLEMEKQKPENWRGFVAPEYQEGDNTRVLNALQRHPSFVLGPAIDMGEYIKHLDPIAQRIIDSAPKEGFAGQHGGNMILDTTKSHYERIILLKPNMGLTTLEFSQPEDIRKLYPTLPVDQRMRLVEYVHRNHPEFKNLLLELAQSETSPEIRSVIAWALTDIGSDPDSRKYGIHALFEKRSGTSLGMMNFVFRFTTDDDGNMDFIDTMKENDTTEQLKWLLHDPDESVRLIASYGLIKQGTYDLPQQNDFYRMMKNKDPHALPHLMTAMYRIHGIQPRENEFDEMKQQALFWMEKEDVKPHPEMAEQLRQFVADEKTPLDISSVAARLLGRTDRVTPGIRQVLLSHYNEVIQELNGVPPFILDEYKNPETDLPKDHKGPVGLMVPFRDPVGFASVVALESLIHAKVAPPFDTLNQPLSRLVNYRDYFRQERVPGLSTDDMMDRLAELLPKTIEILRTIRGHLRLEDDDGQIRKNIGGNRFVEETYQRLLKENSRCRDVVEGLLN